MARSRRIPEAVLNGVAAALRVLAHPQRLRLVELLMEGESPVGRLAERAGLPHAAVSQHLSMMKAHRLVASRRDGRRVLYRVEHPNAVGVIQCIRSHRLE